MINFLFLFKLVYVIILSRSLTTGYCPLLIDSCIIVLIIEKAMSPFHFTALRCKYGSEKEDLTSSLLPMIV